MEELTRKPRRKVLQQEGIRCWEGRRKAFQAAFTGHVGIGIIYSHRVIIDSIFLKICRVSNHHPILSESLQ